MRLGLLLAFAFGLVTVISAPRSHAAGRGIRVDETMECSSQLSTGPTIALGMGNTADSGVASDLPAWICSDSTGTDPTATPFSFDPTTSLLYTWTPPGDDPTGQSLSGYYGADNNDIVAMAEVFNLTGAYLGDTEVLFNYNADSYPPCPASSGSLTWSGTSYSFNDPCDVQPFFFNSSGNQIPAPSVPEPDTLALMSLTLLPVLFWARRRERSSRS
jgi:hypothetical protein